MTYAGVGKHVDVLGEAIIQWARPQGGKWQASPLALHPLADFRSAAAIAVGYLLFVLVFSALMGLSNGPIKNLYGLKFLYNITQVRRGVLLTPSPVLLLFFVYLERDIAVTHFLFCVYLFMNSFFKFRLLW